MADVLLRRCTKCKASKPISDFYPKSFYRCKKCENEKNRKWVQENKERVREYGREWAKRNPEKLRDKFRRQRKAHPRTYKNQDLKKNYGITLIQYEWLLGLQGGKCAICVSPLGSARGTKLGVDHEHTTGRVRGLLCDRCNAVIGLFRDDPNLLRKAVHYLKSGGFIQEDTLPFIPQSLKSKSSRIRTDRERDATLWHLYGIGLVEYNQRYVEQSGRCAICRLPEDGRRLSVDHNHGTGKIRGLLCLKCNKGMGLFLDKQTLFLLAIRYLEGAPLVVMDLLNTDKTGNRETLRRVQSNG